MKSSMSTLDLLDSSTIFSILKHDFKSLSIDKHVSQCNAMLYDINKIDIYSLLLLFIMFLG